MNDSKEHTILRLLLIEDDEVDAQMFLRAVKAHAIDVEIDRAVDGVAALERLRAPGGETPDLCVLDINMPRLNGIGFLEELRKATGIPSFPVFVLTTSTSPRDIHGAFDHHVAGYFVKDIEDSRLDAFAPVLRGWLAETRLRCHTNARIG